MASIGLPFSSLRYRPTASKCLQREAQRVDHAVAHLARLRAGLKRDALAGGQAGVQVGRQRGDGRRRRPERPAQDPARQEHAAMDRRGRGGVGERRHQVRVGQQAGPLLGRASPSGTALRGELGAVELGQPAVEVKLVGQQEPAEVGRFAPDHVFQEQVQRRPQVGGDRSG